MKFNHKQDLLKTEIAYFGAGCFWNSELVYVQEKGIIATEVGWATFSDDDKGSVEVVKLEFDTEKTSYSNLVDSFWKTHNPSNPKNDDDQYVERSVLLFTNASQEEIARRKLLEKKQRGQIYTKVDAFQSYRRAPEKDQGYFFDQIEKRD